MLEAQNKRPTDADTIYVPDFDVATLAEQFKQKSDKLKTAIESGDITISVRAPTQSLLAALVLDVTAYSERLDRAMVTIRALSNGIGREMNDIEVDIGNGQVGINVEQYSPSAFKKEVTYTVANLPA